MTTIAWDGRSLAADRLAVSGGGLRREVRKIYRCGAYLYGGSGMLTVTIEVAAWLSHGATEAARPTLEDDGGHGLVVDRATGRAFYVEGKRPFLGPVRERFAASGSGRDFALSAMAFGKSARAAVLFAARFDVFTCLGVDAVPVKPVRS